MARNLTDRQWTQREPSGLPFFLFDPQPLDFEPFEIALALSHVCRFTGHVRRFYSVAQHSVLVSLWLDAHGFHELAPWGLMHDAAEAYIGDMVRPLKREMPEFKRIEKRIERQIARRWDLAWPMPPPVKQADNAVLMSERNSLKRKMDRRWREEGVQPWPPVIVPMPPVVARDAFLERGIELDLWVASDVERAVHQFEEYNREIEERLAA